MTEGEDICWGADSCKLCYSNKLKSNDLLILTFNKYKVEERCVYRHLREYLGRTYLMRENTVVFETTRSPHQTASKETLSRYVHTTMMEMDINMKHFIPYICRHASTSTAWCKQVPIATILTVAG